MLSSCSKINYELPDVGGLNGYLTEQEWTSLDITRGEWMESYKFNYSESLKSWSKETRGGDGYAYSVYDFSENGEVAVTTVNDDSGPGAEELTRTSKWSFDVTSSRLTLDKKSYKVIGADDNRIYLVPAGSPKVIETLSRR